MAISISPGVDLRADNLGVDEIFEEFMDGNEKAEGERRREGRHAQADDDHYGVRHQVTGHGDEPHEKRKGDHRFDERELDADQREDAGKVDRREDRIQGGDPDWWNTTLRKARAKVLTLFISALESGSNSVVLLTPLTRTRPPMIIPTMTWAMNLPTS